MLKSVLAALVLTTAIVGGGFQAAYGVAASTDPQPVLPGHRFTLKESVLAERAERAAAAQNPLAGGPWGVYRGPWNGIYPAYQRAKGTNKALLGKIALRPRVVWFTGNFSTKAIGPAIANTIKAQQAEYGPNTLVQLALFRMWVGGENARGRALTAAQQTAYRQWIDAAVAAIGTARTAIVLEPDLGLAAIPNNAWEKRTKDAAVRLGLVRYAAQRLATLPRTSVYLDASDSDWLSLQKVVPLLVSAGIQYTRGFALGATHYTSVQANLAYGKAISDKLAASGLADKHFVIDTADNGKPFTWAQNRAGKPSGNFDNAATCKSRTEVRCDTLGIPPTANVVDARLHLTASQAQIAQQYADGYLWFGRPWLVNQASPFSLKRSLAVARTTPFE
ncbi:glycoside hydrolase family 6 protein [Nocardioides sp. Kera G14]|uniref:glycoside hydrolase family 6 protein n=1 Tax=Nocardioides sp. Kera G14 TaxID=2884264 RepID=UPI001D0F94BB|nr:glycoside hydrolase family 6 protein [Nocardioides sp. Kera G14]UDY25299.1 glycoside hydrolase family 6 protein [Nocardioides sp. Kera G14]